MTERERLIRLLEQAKEKATGTIGSMNNGFGAWYADYLLANGVSVPPCKVGQKVWCISNYPDDYTEPMEYQITILSMSENYYSFAMETKDGVYDHYCSKDKVGKWVFFTREEAEAALAERRKEKEHLHILSTTQPRKHLKGAGDERRKPHKIHLRCVW